MVAFKRDPFRLNCIRALGLNFVLKIGGIYTSVFKIILNRLKMRLSKDLGDVMTIDQCLCCSADRWPDHTCTLV